jgi:hypothetical protein
MRDFRRFTRARFFRRERGHQLPPDRTEIGQEHGRAHLFRHLDADQQVDRLGVTQVHPPDAPMGVEPDASTATPIGVDRQSPLPHKSQVARDRPFADTMPTRQPLHRALRSSCFNCAVKQIHPLQPVIRVRECAIEQI